MAHHAHRGGERLPVGIVEARHRRKQPGALEQAALLAHLAAAIGEPVQRLAPVGRMRLALHQHVALEHGQGGAHRLRLDAFGARQIGGGHQAVLVQPRQRGALRQGQLARIGLGAQPPDELPGRPQQFLDKGLDRRGVVRIRAHGAYL